jgi:hypothetical protein
VAQTILLAVLCMATLTGSLRTENLTLCFLFPERQQLFA